MSKKRQCKIYHTPATDSYGWSHPIWKFGCLLPIGIFILLVFVLGIYDIITGKDSNSVVTDKQYLIDSLRDERANLAFEGIVLGQRFSARQAKIHKLRIENNEFLLDSANIELSRIDSESNLLNSRQKILVYTTKKDIVYQIVINMPNDDIYSDAFFEKYGIDHATKADEPNYHIWKWEWLNQSLILKLPKGGLRMTVIYLDKDAVKEHNVEINTQRENEKKELMEEKEITKSNI